MLSPEIAQLAPRPYVAIPISDATHLKIEDGDVVNLTLQGERPFQLAARLESNLPPGIIGIPVGIPGLEGKDVNIPAWVEFSQPAIIGVAS